MADLETLIAAAMKRYDSLTPSERVRHDLEQRRSFVRGMCPTNRDYREWCATVDRLFPQLTNGEGQ